MFYVYWIYFWETENIYNSGYVGITDNLKDRFYKHRKKFGNFKYKIIFTGNQAQAFALELHLRPRPNIGLNKAIGGLQFGVYSPMTGRKHSAETINKIKIGNIGLKRTDETKAKLKIVRTNISEETRDRMRKASTGRKLSEESRAKVSEALRNRVRTEETKKKLSEAAKRQWDKYHAEAEIKNGK